MAMYNNTTENFLNRLMPGIGELLIQAKADQIASFFPDKKPTSDFILNMAGDSYRTTASVLANAEVGGDQSIAGMDSLQLSEKMAEILLGEGPRLHALKERLEHDHLVEPVLNKLTADDTMTLINAPIQTEEGFGVPGSPATKISRAAGSLKETVFGLARKSELGLTDGRT